MRNKIFISLCLSIVLLSGCNQSNSDIMPTTSIYSELNSSDNESISKENSSIHEISSTTSVITQSSKIEISSSSSISSSSVNEPEIISSSSISSSSNSCSNVSNSISSSSITSSSITSSSSSSSNSSSISQSSSSVVSSSTINDIPIEQPIEENCTHDIMVIEYGIQPTCITLGYTPKIVCSKCNEIFTDKTPISYVHTLMPTSINESIHYICKGECGLTFDCEYNKELSENHIRDIILSMKSTYYEEMPFDNSKTYITESLFTNVYYETFGCAAFVAELSDKAFGTLPARHHFDFNNIRVGDIIRLENNLHSAIVLEVNGDEITIAEANFNGTVHWGRIINISDPTVGWSYVLTRYPD